MASSSDLLRLPVELLVFISSLLPNRDIKSLRLTCRRLFSCASLRLTRVFLSANPRDVEVFRTIADHETYRRQIVEIIWDDARLVSHQCEGQDYDNYYGPRGGEPRYYTFAEGDCPRWFWKACEENMTELQHLRREDVDRPDHLARDQLVAERLSLKDSWRHYMDLWWQQVEVLNSGADLDAFRYGLKRLPLLQRVTITPFAHGRLFTALYETPMIRALPRGFNYLIPRSWPVHNSGYRPPFSRQWNQLQDFEKDQWRGFRLATRELAQMRGHTVKELVLDVHYLYSGIDCTIFAEPCAEYNDLVAVLRRPGFRRLDLSMLVGRQGYEQEWNAFRSGYLRLALSQAPDLEHISLATDEDEPCPQGDDPDAHFVPLQAIFPIDKWSRLQHFGLSKVIVRQDDLLPFLMALPATVRSVELSGLLFIQGNYPDLLTEMRDTLDWKSRKTNERPRVLVGTPTRYVSDQTIWVEEEVNDFLYSDGPNPFGPNSRRLPRRGMGVIKDAFNPFHERPNLTLSGLADAGYIKHAYWKGQKIY
jgi:hypothetical protein